MEIKLVPKEIDINVETEEIALQGGESLPYSYQDFSDALALTIQEGNTRLFRDNVLKIFGVLREGELFFKSIEHFDRNNTTVGISDPSKSFDLRYSNEYFASTDAQPRYKYNKFLYEELVKFLRFYLHKVGNTEEASELRKENLFRIPDPDIVRYQKTIRTRLNEYDRSSGSSGGGAAAAVQRALSADPWREFEGQVANAGRQVVRPGGEPTTSLEDEQLVQAKKDVENKLTVLYGSLYDASQKENYDLLLSKLRKIQDVKSLIPPELRAFMKTEYFQSMGPYRNTKLFNYLILQEKANLFFDLLKNIYGSKKTDDIVTLYEGYLKEVQEQDVRRQRESRDREVRREEAQQQLVREAEARIRKEGEQLEKAKQAREAREQKAQEVEERPAATVTGALQAEAPPSQPASRGKTLAERLSVSLEAARDIRDGEAQGLRVLQEGASSLASQLTDALGTAAKNVGEGSSFVMTKLKEALGGIRTYDERSESEGLSTRSSRRSSLSEEEFDEPRQAPQERREPQGRRVKSRMGYPELEGAHFFKMYKSTLAPDIPQSQSRFRLRNQIGLKFSITRYEPRYTDRTVRTEDEIDDIGNEFLNLLTEDEYIIFQGIRDYYGMGKDDKTEGRTTADVSNYNKILLRYQNSSEWFSLMEKIGERTMQLGFYNFGPFSERTNIQKYFILGNLLYSQGTKAKSWEMNNLVSELNRSNL
jgi:uncharacterized protein YecA (UPF0149 family)